MENQAPGIRVGGRSFGNGFEGLGFWCFGDGFGGLGFWEFWGWVWGGQVYELATVASQSGVV